MVAYDTVHVADRGFTSAGHAGNSPLRASGLAGFSLVKSAEQLPDSHQACPPRCRYFIVTCCLILKKNVREGMKAYFLDTNQVRPYMSSPLHSKTGS